MLIRRIEKFTTDKELAVGFKFVENETDIEVSIDEEKWIPLEVYHGTTQIHIFQGFSELEVVRVYYRYKLNDEIITSFCDIRTKFNNSNTNSMINTNIPIDFQIKKKTGGVVPSPKIIGDENG